MTPRQPREPHGSRTGAKSCLRVARRGDEETMNIAVLGYGTVGSALARRLADSTIPNLRLTHILDRRAPIKRDARLGDVVWTTDVEEIFASDAGVVVEVIGGVDPAREWIRTALARGKSVVTANKQALAHGLRD